MKRNKKKLCTLFFTGLCCLAVFHGCGSQGEGNGIEGAGTQDNKIEEPAAQNTQEGAGETVGEFTMQDIEGNTYTQEMFEEYSLTMVNVFTTWCTPCVNEIPDLEKLHNEMADQGVNVVGIVLDSVDSSGNASEEVVELARLLAERTGATYPFLIPDAGYLNGRLLGINAVPETFFVDKEGNIVGETYSGSRSLEDWKSIVEAESKGVGQ